MTSYKFNLGKARMAGRRKRAKKAVSILRKKLEKQEGEVKIASEVNNKIWEQGAEKPPGKIEVEVKEENGEKKVYLAEKTRKTQETSQETEKEKEEYKEILSGTVQEAKDHVKQMEDPDIESLLEAEKEGKDRKTMKQFLENQK